MKNSALKKNNKKIKTQPYKQIIIPGYCVYVCLYVHACMHVYVF